MQTWPSSPRNFGCHTIRRSESIARPSASTPLCSQRCAWTWTSARIPWHAVSIARRKSPAHSVAARTERDVTHVDAGGFVRYGATLPMGIGSGDANCFRSDGDLWCVKVASVEVEINAMKNPSRGRGDRGWGFHRRDGYATKQLTLRVIPATSLFQLRLRPRPRSGRSVSRLLRSSASPPSDHLS